MNETDLLGLSPDFLNIFSQKEKFPDFTVMREGWSQKAEIMNSNYWLITLPFSEILALKFSFTMQIDFWYLKYEFCCSDLRESCSTNDKAAIYIF